MADETTDAKFAALSAKIEKESRFTRSLVVVCTAAMLGVSLVPVKIMLSDLPTLIIAEIINKMEILHSNWKVYDKIPNGGSGGSSITSEAPAK
jgi:hypothetical protein